MNTRHELNELLSTLGMPALEFDANGCASLLFNDSIAVNFEHDRASGLLHLYTDLGPLPVDGRETVYRALLEANLFGVETRGATLALDQNQNQVVLFKTVHDSSLTLSSFSQLLAGFVDCATLWQQRLISSADGPESRAEGQITRAPSIRRIRSAATAQYAHVAPKP